MNISFLRAETNIKISDTEPLEYLRDFGSKVKNFDKILQSHIIPEEYIQKNGFSPELYQAFLIKRAELIGEALNTELDQVEVHIVD